MFKNSLFDESPNTEKDAYLFTTNEDPQRRFYQRAVYCVSNAIPEQVELMIKTCPNDDEQFKIHFTNVMNWYPGYIDTGVCGNDWVTSQSIPLAYEPIPGQTTVDPAVESEQCSINPNNPQLLNGPNNNIICSMVSCAKNLNLTNEEGYKFLENQCITGFDLNCR